MAKDFENTGPAPRWRPEGPPVPAGVPVVHLKSIHFGTFFYEKMIGLVQGSPADGELVAVADKAGRLFGWGFYNGRAPLRLRMFSRTAERPEDAEIGRRIIQAVKLRRELLKLELVTDAYRLIHAEGDGLTGLVADRLGGHVVIELFSLAMYQRLGAIQDACIDAGLSVGEFIVRVDKTVAEQEGIPPHRLRDPKAPSTVITENGVRFAVDLAKGHKTGFFCDQRENRLALSHLAAGKRVLDVCCYTGGFALYAAARGQAAEVTAVDLDEKAIAVAEKNAALNGVAIQIDHADAFDFLRHAVAASRQWDVVVVDPSKFVPRRTAMELGLRKYADLNRLAAAAVAPGGILLTCSCSGLVDQATFVQTVGRAVRTAGRSLQIFAITGAAADHPFQADTPESQYLKAVWGRVL
jgi:23S rRNA (cytosine1962-C5)-methyltransferase